MDGYNNIVALPASRTYVIDGPYSLIYHVPNETSLKSREIFVPKRIPIFVNIAITVAHRMAAW